MADVKGPSASTRTEISVLPEVSHQSWIIIGMVYISTVPTLGSKTMLGRGWGTKHRALPWRSILVYET